MIKTRIFICIVFDSYRWPNYASGAGYVVSHDIVHLMAYPPLPLVFQENEDRRLGNVLFGMNVTYVYALFCRDSTALGDRTGLTSYFYIPRYTDSIKFKPWGQCTPGDVMLHYHRDPGLVKRRYERVLNGQDMCGEGWPQGQVCARAEQGQTLEISCPVGLQVDKVIFANYGTPLEINGGPKYPWCLEGMSGITVDPKCQASGIKDRVAMACGGKQNCSIRVDKHLGLDPCPGQRKHLQSVVHCRAMYA